MLYSKHIIHHVHVYTCANVCVTSDTGHTHTHTHTHPFFTHHEETGFVAWLDIAGNLGGYELCRFTRAEYKQTNM